jgi:hypothetical protein
MRNHIWSGSNAMTTADVIPRWKCIPQINEDIPDTKIPPINKDIPDTKIPAINEDIPDTKIPPRGYPGY